MKRLLSLALLLTLLVTLPLSLTACNDLPDGNTVVLEVKDYGNITLVLDPEAAPKTVEHFKKLVNDGVYDGATFYRIVNDFVIQGGLMNPEDIPTVKGEFSKNGVNNTRKHQRGTLSLARSNDPDSGSSEFFIVLETSQNNTLSLDGKYAAFGYVSEGMDVVDAIAASPTYGEYALTDIVITRAYLVEEGE